MKTSIKTLSTILTIAISLNLTAQHRDRKNNHPVISNSTQDDNAYASAGQRIYKPWAGNSSVYINNYSYNGYNNYNLKKAARNSIRKSAQLIGQALQFNDWNDIYSPWLAKAIRHQQYAKQLYYWGDYSGALNHTERAGFLASNMMNYFNSSCSYNTTNYTNPYGAPNNPYYRKGNAEVKEDANNEDGMNYRKVQPNQTQENEEMTIESFKKSTNAGLDHTLPQSKMNDKELLNINAKDLDVD